MNEHANNGHGEGSDGNDENPRRFARIGIALLGHLYDCRRHRWHVVDRCSVGVVLKLPALALGALKLGRHDRGNGLTRPSWSAC